MTDRLLDTVACLFVPKIGPVRFRALLEKEGFEGVARLTASHPEALESAKKELLKARQAGVRILAVWDEAYPAILKEIHDAPIVLFVKGSIPDRPSVGVVGSRVPSMYGTSSSMKIAGELASAGVTVVSGMARGIDTSAHQGALAAGGFTVAVLGSGLNKIYPPENLRLAGKIASNGALISEHPMDTEARGEFFPLRNRIISGLSKAVVVVEAKEKSGALITADQALEQGRDVYAVPGNIDSARSRGTNLLLKQGARPLVDTAELLEDLKAARPAARKIPAGKLGSEEASLLELIGSGAPVHADEIIEKSGLSTGRALSHLSTLAMKGFTKELPGKYYVTA